MKMLGLFVAGFASGWVVRGTVDSSRDLVVGAIATAYGVMDRAKRVVAMEREHLEDLMAEGKARFEAKRARANARASATNGPATRVAEVVRPREERAA